MQFIENNRILFIILVFLAFLITLVVFNIVYIMHNGENVAAPEIPRDEITIGSGEQLDYLILGDSTAIAQGGSYENGYAVGTSRKLAESYTVTYQNFGVSGATLNDVLVDQLVDSEAFIPDVVIIAAGANDVTHLTSLKSIERDTEAIIENLRSRNSEVKIVFTGSAAMGSVLRFPQPTRWLAGVQTDRVNAVMERATTKADVTFAYIARETKEKFADNPQYFAADNFHPNDEGYAEWTKVLNSVISNVL